VHDRDGLSFGAASNTGAISAHGRVSTNVQQHAVRCFGHATTYSSTPSYSVIAFATATAAPALIKSCQEKGDAQVVDALVARSDKDRTCDLTIKVVRSANGAPGAVPHDWQGQMGFLRPKTIT
jgi:hypothetical protein